MHTPNQQFMAMAETSTFGIFGGRNVHGQNVRGQNVLHSDHITHFGQYAGFMNFWSYKFSVFSLMIDIKV